MLEAHSAASGARFHLALPYSGDFEVLGLLEEMNGNFSASFQVAMFCHGLDGDSLTLGRVLRPLREDGKEFAGKKNKIRIHSGSIPCHVEGCIAPGYRNPVGNGLPMIGSRVTMNWILINCGDWKDGKIVGVLFVIEDYSVPDAKHLRLREPNCQFSTHSVLKRAATKFICTKS
jgi:hypothetical protein